MNFDQFIKDDAAVRSIFEQARNVAVTGVIFAGGLWLWDIDSRWTAIVLFSTAALLAGLQQLHIMHRVT